MTSEASGCISGTDPAVLTRSPITELRWRARRRTTILARRCSPRSTEGAPALIAVDTEDADDSNAKRLILQSVSKRISQKAQQDAIAVARVYVHVCELLSLFKKVSVFQILVIPVPAEAATETWVAAMVAAPEQAKMQLSEYSTSLEQLETQ